MTDKEKEIVQALRCCKFGLSCEKCPVVGEKDCFEEVNTAAAELIESLTAENAALREKQRWIPVTERLPERDVQVLGWYKDNPFSQYRPEVVAWNGNGWVFVYAHRYVTNVTHWMPLPEAPEKGGKACECGGKYTARAFLDDSVLSSCDKEANRA